MVKRSSTRVMRLSMLMLAASALLFGLVIFGSVTENRRLLKVAVLLIGAFALVGIVFNVWANWTGGRRT